MIDIPDWLTVGAYVNVIGAGCGRIVDICHGNEHVLIGLHSAKCAARFQPIEWLDYTLDPGQWTQATPEQVLADYRNELTLAQRAIALATKREVAISQCIDGLH